jgi:hypothetical protein
MISKMTYKVQQAEREWEWEDSTTLISIDGVHQITQDPVYGYFKLTTVEDPTESISESLIMHELVLMADSLIKPKD